MSNTMLPPPPANCCAWSRHWCPVSEPYTGGDSLMAALYAGWLLDTRVTAHVRWYGSGIRRVTVYHFLLRNGVDERVMRVVSTPFIEQLIRQQALNVIVREEESWETLCRTSAR